MLSLASAFEKFINDVDSVADCLNTSLLDKYLEEARTNLEAYKECIISSHQGVDDKHELTDEELWGVWNNHDGPIPEILRVAIDADRSRFGHLAPNTKYKLIIPDGDPHSAQVWYVQRKGEVVELCISVDSEPSCPVVDKDLEKLCQWLVNNSSGIYRPAAHAAFMLRQLDSLARDAVGGMRYIEESYGRLYGVGWDRVFDVADRIIPASKREIA